MEIKKEDLSTLIQDIKLLTSGLDFKEIIVDTPDAPSQPKFKDILQGYQPSLDRVKQYIEEWTIVSDLFQNTFPDFYKKHSDDTTQISKRKIHISYHNKDQNRFDPNKTAQHELKK